MKNNNFVFSDNIGENALNNTIWKKVKQFGYPSRTINHHSLHSSMKTTTAVLGISELSVEPHAKYQEEEQRKLIPTRFNLKTIYKQSQSLHVKKETPHPSVENSI